MADTSTVAEIVRNVLRDQFDIVRVAKIAAEPGVDQDGDHIWYVKVVLDDTELKRVDARTASGMVRYLRSRMIEAGDEDFPIVSFIAKSEAGKLSPEAA